MENQQAQQTTILVAEFNDMKNKLKNLVHMMFVMMRRFESQAPP